MDKELNLTLFKLNSNEDYDFNGQDYVIFDEPKDFVKFYIPYVIRGSGRLNFNKLLEFTRESSKLSYDYRYAKIMGLASNFKYLNPQISDEEVLKVMNMLNCKCENPLNDFELGKMHEDLIKNEVIPTYHTVSFIINPNLTAIRKEKFKNFCKGILKKRKTADRISNLLANWRVSDGQINFKSVSNRLDLTAETISKYFKESKELQEQLTAAKKRLKQSKVNGTYIKIEGILKRWNLKEWGKPTNPNIAEQTGFSAETVKGYAKNLNWLKKLALEGKTVGLDLGLDFEETENLIAA